MVKKYAPRNLTTTPHARVHGHSPEPIAERIWPRLYVFRAVAETGSLPSASRRLRITPSAISRTIRLLEDDLDATLFTRASYGLVINDRGQALLVAATDAQRIIEAYVRGLSGIGG